MLANKQRRTDPRQYVSDNVYVGVRKFSSEQVAQRRELRARLIARQKQKKKEMADA